MKTALTFVALFSLAVALAAASLEVAGVSLPDYVTAETALGLFVGAFVLMSFGAEYGRQPTLDRVQQRPHLLPESSAFLQPRAVFQNSPVCTTCCPSHGVAA
jgi:hypothetical protein